MIKEVETATKTTIRGFEIDYVRNYVFTSGMDGHITILDMGKLGKERFTKIVGHLEGKAKVNIIQSMNPNLFPYYCVLFKINFDLGKMYGLASNKERAACCIRDWTYYCFQHQNWRTNLYISNL